MTNEGLRIDADGVAWWIAETTNVDLGTVQMVLAVRDEYMVGVGIMYSPDGAQWEFEFYDPHDLEPTSFIDDDRIARDVEHFTGIPYETASTVLDGEFAYLQMRGIA